MTLTIMLVLFAVFLLAGTPMGFAMGLSAVTALWVQGDVPLIQLPLRFFNAIDNYALMAVLLFILAGELMNVGGITQRIVAFANALIGHIRGGLAQVNILTSILFAGVSGSAMADTAAVGSMLIPAMKREGYDSRFAVVVTAASSLIGPIIPPSITAVIYGSITGVSIGRLFLAGVIPGLLAGGAMMVLTWFLASRYGWKPSPKAPWRKVGRTFVSTSPALTMPLIIVGGIVTGIFTPTEAGAVAVLYGIFVATVSRNMGLTDFLRFILNSTKLTASALVVLAGAGLFGWVLTREGFGFMLQDALMAVSDNSTVVMLMIMFGLFIIGMFVEGTAAMIIVVPIVAPIAHALGFAPVQFGMTAILMLLVGAITPPVGIVALLACRIGGVEYSRTFGLLMPYIGIILLVIFAVAFIPPLTTWLPDLLL